MSILKDIDISLRIVIDGRLIILRIYRYILNNRNYMKILRNLEHRKEMNE